jgi:hypothetical protein
MPAPEIENLPDLTLNEWGIAYWQTPKSPDKEKEYFAGDKSPEGEYFYNYAPCFGDVLWTIISRIRFAIRLNEDTDPNAFYFYLRFLKTILNDQTWEGKLIYGREHILGALFSLDIKGAKYRNLLHASAMRYSGKEFGGLLAALYRELKKFHCVEHRFWAFQQIHLDNALGTGEYATITVDSNVGHRAHCVMWPSSQYGGSGIAPISLAKFRENLEKGMPSVQSHFS